MKKCVLILALILLFGVIGDALAYPTSVTIPLHTTNVSALPEISHALTTSNQTHIRVNAENWTSAPNVTADRGWGDSDHDLETHSDPTILDYQKQINNYQKQIDALYQNGSVTAIAEICDLYGNMISMARDRGEADDEAQFTRLGNMAYTELDLAKEDARKLSHYQASLGMNESDLNARFNSSANQADADPLNASRWQELSDAAQNLGLYHGMDSSRFAFYVLKDDADHAAKIASAIQQYGMNSYEVNELLNLGGTDGNCSTTVLRAAKKTEEIYVNKAVVASYRHNYEITMRDIANNSNNTTGPDSYKAWANLAADYIFLANAISDWDAFNRSNNLAMHNTSAYPEPRLNAVKCFDQAIKTAQNNPVSRYWIDEGRVYNALGDKANATKCFDQGIASAAKEHNNETLIGCLYLKAKNVEATDLDQAAKCYEAILSIDSYDSRIWKPLSQVYKKLGRYNDASDANDYANSFKYESHSTLPNLPSVDL